MNSKLRTSTKILIVDDHPLVREGIVAKLASQADLAICGEAETENEALALIKTTNPELVLVDISLKDGHGLDLIKQIKANYPGLKILVLSGFKESLYGERCLRAGAGGYLNKQESNAKLVEAIRTVLEGNRFISPELTRRLVSHALNPAEAETSIVDILTDRELEVFRLIGEGATSTAIATQLFLSTHTIDSHRENIKRKLGVDNAAALARVAVEWVLSQR